MSKKDNKFSGADDIYQTRKNIAVRRIQTVRTKKGSHLLDKTNYYPKTRKNLNTAQRIYGNIRWGR